MNNREKLFDFILSLTDEEAEKIVASLRNSLNKPISGGKETK